MTGPTAEQLAEQHLENYERRQLSGRAWISEQDKGTRREATWQQLRADLRQSDAEARRGAAVVAMVIFAAAAVLIGIGGIGLWLLTR